MSESLGVYRVLAELDLKTAELGSAGANSTTLKSQLKPERVCENSLF